MDGRNFIALLTPSAKNMFAVIVTTLALLAALNFILISAAGRDTNCIRRLQSLRSDIADYVATYSRPMTPTPHLYDYFRRRVTSMRTGWTKRTKMTTKRSYALKRRYPKFNERIEIHHKYFVTVFSLYNETLKKELLSLNITTKNANEFCYLDVYSTFMELCYYEYYEHRGMDDIKNLLVRTCHVRWLSANRVNYILRQVCKETFKFAHIKVHELPS